MAIFSWAKKDKSGTEKDSSYNEKDSSYNEQDSTCNEKDIFPSDLGPEIVAFDHITWYVGNARQAASYYVTRLGFEHVAYRGPETGSRTLVAYVVANRDCTFVLISPGRAPIIDEFSDEALMLSGVQTFLAEHGDGVKDVAFRIEGDVESVSKRAVCNGAKTITPPRTIKDGDNGTISFATVAAYGPVSHTLINRQNYTGPFFPQFAAVTEKDSINRNLPPIDLIEVDHCVGNHQLDCLDSAVKYYEECFGFHRYWTVDDANMCGEYSAMRSIVVASPNESVKMPMNEPASGKKKSQVQEFVEYHGGAGVQHIAFRTDDIVTAVSRLKQRGMAFLRVPDEYYTDLRQRLASGGPKIAEDIDKLQDLHILVDFDEKGYLLQIFTKHILERPTVFLEVIQRNNFDGFGAGNFKGLFQAFEREQALRGNLSPVTA
ncbi:4-hydroxyphenylpyruvate dioxygenase family protein [Aspergillus homomorphus CBS 101889]|uniref:4-hydroxyphenylpyruvate dioxygenase n=1 Tax=Aspergillus homomorphus (strain CBS 101889) TaxID=1450537 RepID=A0A395HPH9_ASPHC|nr:4-hydroxyphenylpyruvate dioxygenase [Aspergillus homomorphus CBS 101889]RAL09727.1 4-hydroxyphenylpyruvate dioxygenase [Aspergillus homomorphus CBS 101889]